MKQPTHYVRLREERGAAIEDVRQKTDLSRAEFARALGVDAAAVSAWEADRSWPSEEQLVVLTLLSEDPQSVRALLSDGARRAA